MAELGDYLTAINKTKKNIMREPGADDPKAISGFQPFIVRKLLSYHPDAIEAANIMNTLPHLDPQLQFEFLLHLLPKRNRFARLEKVDPSENIELLKKYYNYNDERAAEVLILHTEEDLQKIRAHFSEGGLSREKQSSR